MCYTITKRRWIRPCPCPQGNERDLSNASLMERPLELPPRGRFRFRGYMPKGDHWHDVRGLTDMDIIGFGVKNGRLTVHFVSKTHSSTYVYTPNRGDEEICCRWIQSDSIGQFFHRSIKPLPYAKIS